MGGGAILVNMAFRLMNRSKHKGSFSKRGERRLFHERSLSLLVERRSRPLYGEAFAFLLMASPLLPGELRAPRAPRLSPSPVLPGELSWPELSFSSLEEAEAFALMLEKNLRLLE